MLQSVRLDGVLQKHGDRHGPDAARDGRDVGALGCDLGVVHVAAEFAVFVAVHADVDDDGAFLDHVGFQELGFAYRHAHDVCAGSHFPEIAGAAVAYGDGGVAVEQELREGFAHEIGSADDDGALPFYGDVVVIQQLDDAVGGAGYELGLTRPQLALLDEMAAVHVLCGIDEMQERRLVEVTGHGKLQEDAVDCGIGVEGRDLFRHFLLRGVRRHLHESGRYAHLRAAVYLVAHIHLTCGVVSYEDDGKPDLAEGVLRQRRDLPRDVFAREFCNEFSVDDLHMLSLSAAGVAGVLLNDVVRAALRDAGGGDDGHLRGLLELLYGDGSAVAHGGTHLIKALFHVVFEAAGVGDVAVHTLLEGEPGLAAEVVTLPIAGAVAALPPILFDVVAVDVEFVRGALVEAGEISAQHEEVRTHGKREGHVIVVHYAAVRADGDVDARLFVVLVPCLCDLDERARLPSAYALLLAGDADGTAADAHLDKVRSALGEEEESVTIDDVARAHFDGIAVIAADIFEGALLPDAVTLGRVDAQDVHARVDECGDTLLVVQRIDARAHHIPLVVVKQLQGVLLVLGVVLAEDDVHQIPLIRHDGYGIELVLPNDIVRLRKTRRRGSGDQLLERGHEFLDGGLEGHTADAVVAAGHDAEQFAEAGAVVRDRYGVVTLPAHQLQNVGKGAVGSDVGVGHHKARLIIFDTLHHRRLVLHRLRAVNERYAAFARERYGEGVIAHRLHDRRHQRDVERDRGFLAPCELDQRSAQTHVGGDAVLVRVAGDEKIFAESS